jgi:hypothetical protein
VKLQHPRHEQAMPEWELVYDRYGS